MLTSTSKEYPLGSLLRGSFYTSIITLKSFSVSMPSHISARKRTIKGEPEHFSNQAPLPPDPNNIDHMEWIKISQWVLGAMLWLHARAAQVLTRDIESLKVRSRPLLQHINTTKTLGLFYQYPTKRELTDFTFLGDASFALAGKCSQSGHTIHLSFGTARHLIHWQLLREAKISESSAQAELYTLATARKAARNFSLLNESSSMSLFPKIWS